MRKQNGNVSIIVALSMLMLIAVGGLAIDSGLGYMTKAKLNAALDSATLAAARAVARGVDQAAQKANATAAAQQFFTANYPSGYLGSTARLDTPSITFDGGTVTIGLSARADMPVSIMQLMGFNKLNVAARSETIRKDLDLALIMDTSGSLQSSGATVKSSAISFLNKFNPSTDRIALIHFSYGAVVDDSMTSARGFNLSQLTNHISNYTFEVSTNSSEGLWHGRQQLNQVPLANRSSLRVMVFFSDGSPNSFASYFPFNNPADCATAGTIISPDRPTGKDGDKVGGLYRIDQTNTMLPGNCAASGRITPKLSRLPDWYNAHNPASNPNDPGLRVFPIVTNSPRVVSNDLSSSTAAAYRNVNRAARNLAEAVAAKARDEDIYVFTLGLGSQLKSPTGADNEKGEDLLKCLANTPDALPRCYNPKKPVGLYCYAATDSDLSPCFARLASAIMRISK